MDLVRPGDVLQETKASDYIYPNRSAPQPPMLWILPGAGFSEVAPDLTAVGSSGCKNADWPNRVCG